MKSFYVVLLLISFYLISCNSQKPPENYDKSLNNINNTVETMRLNTGEVFIAFYENGVEVGAQIGFIKPTVFPKPIGKLTEEIAALRDAYYAYLSNDKTINTEIQNARMYSFAKYYGFDIDVEWYVGDHGAAHGGEEEMARFSAYWDLLKANNANYKIHSSS